jgi:hypothetical protein
MLLKDEGGWATLRMVERYAHLMPSERVAGVADIRGLSHPRIDQLAQHAIIDVSQRIASL